MAKTQQTCGNCRFLDDTYKDGKPRCHRYPPQAKDETHFSDSPISQKFEVHLWRFPEVDKENDWCGEWQSIDNSGNRSVYPEE